MAKTKFFAALALLVAVYLYRRYRKTIEYAKKSKEVARLIRQAASAKPFLTFSATKLAKLIRERQLTAEEVVSSFIAHLEDVNPYMNAICDKSFNTAMGEAKKADELLDSLKKKSKKLAEIAEKRPFLGVPFIAKESHEVPGLRYTAGLVGLKEKKGSKWNPVLWRVKEAGAILLATGNTSEACMWYESHNNVYGRTKNPYDLTRTVGGKQI